MLIVVKLLKLPDWVRLVHLLASPSRFNIMTQTLGGKTCPSRFFYLRVVAIYKVSLKFKVPFCCSINTLKPPRTNFILQGFVCSGAKTVFHFNLQKQWWKRFALPRQIYCFINMLFVSDREVAAQKPVPSKNSDRSSLQTTAGSITCILPAAGKKSKETNSAHV